MHLSLLGEEILESNAGIINILFDGGEYQCAEDIQDSFGEGMPSHLTLI
jgi:hypothetical protein